MADYLDVNTDQLKPGWIPEGWERGDPIKMFKGWHQFSFIRMMKGQYTPQDESDKQVNEVAYHFDNYRLRDFEQWLAWWNYE